MLKRGTLTGEERTPLSHPVSRLSGNERHSEVHYHIRNSAFILFHEV